MYPPVPDKALNPTTSFEEFLAEELCRDPQFAAIYLQEAFEALDDPQERGASLLAIRHGVQARGGLRKVAAEAGISRESLYRALSAKGNPTLNTLLAVLGAVGMRLAVEPVDFHFIQCILC